MNEPIRRAISALETAVEIRAQYAAKVERADELVNERRQALLTLVETVGSE